MTDDCLFPHYLYLLFMPVLQIVTLRTGGSLLRQFESSASEASAESIWTNVGGRRISAGLRNRLQLRLAADIAVVGFNHPSRCSPSRQLSSKVPQNLTAVDEPMMLSGLLLWMDFNVGSGGLDEVRFRIQDVFSSTNLRQPEFVRRRLSPMIADERR